MIFWFKYHDILRRAERAREILLIRGAAVTGGTFKIKHRKNRNVSV
jgi:hypothetical protein